LVIVRHAALDDVDEGGQVGEHGAAHQDRGLLHDLDAGVPRLPRFLGPAHRLEKGKEGRDAEGGGHDGKGARGRVAHVLVDRVDVRPHRGNHGREPRRFGQIRDDLPPFHARIMVFVDEQGLDDDQNFVDIGADRVVERVEHPVHHFDEQVPLLVF
jgi:hypothetical protein